MKFLSIISLLLFSTFLFGQHQNIKISRFNSPEEPTICLNFLDPQYIVAGANMRSYYYSVDGGLSWERNGLSSSYGVAGDPCVISDKYGDFYYLHLSSPQDGSWLDRIVCQKSTDNGVTWDNGTYMGLSGAKEQDKQWAVADFSNNSIYVSWTQFDKYGSASADDKSNIMFSRSENSGQTWSEAIQINEISGNCIDSDNTTEGAVPAIGPNGEIFISWSLNEKIYFDRSFDYGKTWMDNDIEVATQPTGWDYSIPGISRCNGLPITCCDTSQSSYRGNIYINWTDQRNGSDDTDVWLSKSTDGGSTWSEPKRVNDDTTNSHQFLTWMTVDQANGTVYFIFYDRREYSNETTDVYMAVSKDGGETFENFKISESPFLPRDDVFFGDYNNITAYNNVVRPIWTRLHYDSAESGLSVWTAIIDTDFIGVDVNTQFYVSEETIYPNPAKNLSFYSFKLRQSANVSLTLYDSYGKVVKSLLQNKSLLPGKYIEKVDIESENLTTGLYMYVLSYNNNRKVKKLVVED